MLFSVAEPPETLSISIVAVSFDVASYILSSIGVNDVVPVVFPAVIVISDKLLKSVPSVAVPDFLFKPTVTFAVVATDKVAVKVIDDPESSAIELAEDVRVLLGLLFHHL